MQPDMMRQLQQFQRQAEQLGQLARDLAAATPRRSDGTDATGGVRIVLGPDEFPVEIQIRDGWQQRLEPDRLGAAVLEANTDAVQRAMRAWTEQLDDSGWWRRRADVDGTAASGDGVPDLPYGQRRESADLAEDVLASLQAVQRQPVVPAIPDESVDDGRHVAVQVGPGGLTGCTIDPGWAARSNSSSINAALSSALQRAAAKHSATPRPNGKIDATLGDALATLTSFTLHPPAQGGTR
jgi:DNA-binding protein YbaB